MDTDSDFVNDKTLCPDSVTISALVVFQTKTERIYSLRIREIVDIIEWI